MSIYDSYWIQKSICKEALPFVYIYNFRSVTASVCHQCLEATALIWRGSLGHFDDQSSHEPLDAGVLAFLREDYWGEGAIHVHVLATDEDLAAYTYMYVHVCAVCCFMCPNYVWSGSELQIKLNYSDVIESCTCTWTWILFSWKFIVKLKIHASPNFTRCYFSPDVHN